jgi:Ca2+-binding RTX toxin-like protein
MTTYPGTSGSDTIPGSAGNDIFYSGGGNDVLGGSGGNDTFIYNTRGFARGTIVGFNAGDKIDLSALGVPDLATLLPVISQLNGSAVITLGYNGFVEQITIQGVTKASLTAADFVFESPSTGRTVPGNGGNDVLFGGNGNDNISGASGADILLGGSGNDTLNGGSGDDQLLGGAGNDTFAYDTRGFAHDTIIGFVHGQDKIDLSALGVPDLATLLPVISQLNGDAVITLGYNGFVEEITIQGITKASLTAADFVFENPSTGRTVPGNGGNDVLFGGNGNDNISGASGADILLGGSGNDTLNGGSGDDQLLGGAGNDTFAYDTRGFAHDTIIGFVHGQDKIDLSALGVPDLDTLLPFISQTGADALITLGYGGFVEQITIQGVTKVSLTAADFVFESPSTGRTVLGSGGNDVLFGGNGNDTLSGDSGNDGLAGGAGNDLANGGFGNDAIYLGAGNDVAYGGDGNDIIDLGDGNDAAAGEAGNDTILGGAGTEYLYGGEGNDTLFGQAGVDFLFGEGGADAVYGGTETDGISGGAGNDYVFGEGGTDYLFGDDGNDYVYGGAEYDFIYGGNGVDALFGEGGGDFLAGEGGTDYIAGGDGNDYIYGGDGVDFLYGQAGNDTFAGGLGAPDAFYHDGFVGGNDVVLDFEAGLDVVVLLGTGIRLSRPGPRQCVLQWCRYGPLHRRRRLHHALQHQYRQPQRQQYPDRVMPVSAGKRKRESGEDFVSGRAE